MTPPPEPPRDFGSFYRATLAPLRRYLARLLGNAPEAQDIAHDAYLRVYPTLNAKNAGRNPCSTSRRAGSPSTG